MHPYRRLPSMALFFSLILMLLAACGSAPSSQSVPVSAPAAGAGSSGLSSAERENSAPPAPAATAPADVMGLPATDASSGDAEKPPIAGEVAAAPTDGGLGEASPASRPQGQVANLKAGEIDDNDDFAAYLDYLRTYQMGEVRQVDPSERYLIRVIDDNQRPVLDARISIYAGEELVFQGRTYAGGETIFLPRVIGVSPNATTFRLVANYGNASAEVSFERGSSAPIEVGLRGVQIDPTLRLDLLFLLDTTGSMGDELYRIQETIDSIAQRIDTFNPRPQIRYGLVAYKDEGDEYVTRPVAFTTDLAAFRAELNALTAMGGGDTPEAVDAALEDALLTMEWSDQAAVRLVFLVADAGPHTYEQMQFTYLDGAREAVARGVKIYPIAASNTDAPAEYVFRQLAQQTMAGFIFLTYQEGASSGAPGESTTLEAGDQPYTVERLDDLIVSIVQRELAAAVGVR
ncbi:vWA domain-containing protein [Candidatus Oscillochloris fontis]|uniref:vWA domain-containing protein n=1 Tax=Candidatus Oscillochloris fontis TaxID=2496868 RepID=UPI0013756080|nr:vWA domain-containing protein [Candidatus Oscillochloris fontis]